MNDNVKHFLLALLERGSQPVQWHLKFSDRLRECRFWQDESFRKITAEHGFLPEDMVSIFHGVANCDSLACQDLWKIEKVLNSIILTTTQPVIREFGAVM